MGYYLEVHVLHRRTKALREGSAQKRSAILVAARELFLADGLDRSSVDAVAARAGVSKRTVYDYFGDKQALLLAVVESTGDLLMAAIRRAIADTLTHVTDLEDALITFSARIVTEMLGSVDYLALMRLVTMESVQLSQLRGRDHWMMNAPEEAIAERFAEFARAGLLDAPNPRQAADHFIALTFLLAASAFGPVIAPNDARMREILVEGCAHFFEPTRPAARTRPRPLA